MVDNAGRPQMTSRHSRPVLAQVAALAVLLVGALFVFGGLQLSGASGRFPIMLGGTVVALALLEFVSVTFSKASDAPAKLRGKMELEEVKAIAWIFLTIVAIYLSGILLGSFVSTIVFCRFIERRRLIPSAVISASNVFVIWFAFSYLAKFTLYRGVIF
jgi:hypothetical protein